MFTMTPIDRNFILIVFLTITIVSSIFTWYNTVIIRRDMSLITENVNSLAKSLAIISSNTSTIEIKKTMAEALSEVELKITQ